MVGREEISQRDKKLEEQRKEIELLKTQRKKTTESPDGFTEGKKCMQSPLIVERMNEQDDSDDIHQLTLDSISLSDDPGDTIRSSEDEFKAEKQPAAVMNEDDISVHSKKEWPSLALSPVSSRCSKLESYAASSEDLFPSAKEHGLSLRGSLISANQYSDKEELSEDDQYSPKESSTIINNFDARSSLSATPESLQAPQDREISPYDDDSSHGQPLSTAPLLTTSVEECQVLEPPLLYMLLLLAATIGMNSCQLSSVDSDVHISQPPPEIIPCASECSDESLPQLEFKSSREQLCEETDQIRVPIDNLGAKQQPLRSELLMQENTLPIAKTTVRDQGSQTTTKECVQNLDRTLSNPPQSVISSGQTHHQPTLPSGHGEAGSPYPEGVSQARNTVTESQEMIPPPNSSESQTTSISQHSDVGAKATLECMSTTQPLHRQTEHQSSANYNITCILQFLQQLSQASQTGQLQNNSPGKFYPQDTNEQRQTENKEHQSLSQCEDSQVCPLQMHSSLVQPHSGSQALQRASQVQLSRPHPVQQTQAQPSQMWSPPVEPSQSSTVYTAQPLTAQMLPSEVQSRPVQPPQVQPSQTLPSPLELVPQPPQMKLTHQVTPPPVQRSLSPPASAPQNKPPRDQVESPPTLPSQPLHESKPYQNQEQASLMEPSGNQVQLPPLTQVPIQPSPVQPLQLRRPPSQIQPSQPPIPIHTAQVELFAGSSKSSLARCNKDSQLLHNNEPQAMCITSQGNILSHILPTSASMTSGSAEVHLVPTLQHPSTPGYAKHQSQTQTAASGLHSDHQGGTQHSLSVNCGLSPQVPARQSEPLGNGPFYPQRSGEQQGRQNLAQKSSSSPQLPQPQGHAGQPYSQPSQIQPQQTATVQGPQQHIINNVSGLPDAQIFDSQSTQLPQSYDSPALMVKTYVPVSPTNAQIPLQGNQMQTGATHCSNPPIIDRQQSGVLVQPSTGNVHTQTPDWVSTVQIPDAGLHDQRVVQTTSKPQEGQLSEQVANHTQLSNYGLPPPYTKHQSSPPSTSVQGASQLSYHHGATQAPCIPTTTSDSFGQTPMQHSTISPSGRRSAGGLYSNSLPTLHERIEEMPIRLQRQRTTDSHHGQHPLPQHGEQQINFGNRYAQQETLDTKPRNIYTSEPQVHCNINPTNGSQQTNVLDKAQAIPMDNNLRGKEKPSYQHVHSRIGQHNPASDISQQLRQGHPESLRAVMASSGASSHPPQTRQEYVNMHGAGGNNGSGRQIPLPQTRTSYKGSGQDRVHTAPVGHHSMHSTQPHTPLSRQPQSVYNQSNVQAGIPSKSIGASVFTDTANGNVPHGYYGAMDNQRKASTAPQYLHSTTEDENNVSYHGSLSGSTNASRGATFQHYQHQNQGQPMNVQPEKQYQTTAIRTQQSHVQVNPPTAGSNTCPPLAQTVSHWQGRYGQQSSVSSEESSIGSPGNYPSPQSSIESSSSSKQYQDTFHRNQRATGARHPIRDQDETAAQQIQRSPSNDSERSFRGSTTMSYAHSPSEMEPVPPHIAAERRRAQTQHLGYYPSPEQSLHQPIHVHRPPDKRQYHRSDSAVTYPKHRSEPSMHRPPRGRRKRLPPRSHRTAPVVFFLPQSYDPYDPYYGYDQDYESRHYRFTEQHYPEDVDDDDYEHDVIKYGGEQEVWYQRQPSGAEPRYTGFHSHRERNPSEQELRYQQQPLEAGDHLRRERSISESSNRQTSHQTSHSCSTDSSVSLDSPGVRSGPADEFAFISQQKDEQLIQVLGRSDKAEEYSVVLMHPQHIDDLSSPWTATFAVCRRRPNCINALLQIIQDPSGSRYKVSHINIFFEPEGKLILDIPKSEAEKQGYTISSDTIPCLIRRFEATPTVDRPHADAVYPPRRVLTIYPHSDVQQRQPLNIQLKLLGAKDCVRHFVLTSPLPISSAHQTTRQFTSTHLQHTHPLPPPTEHSDIFQKKPDATEFLHMVGDKISLKWRALAAYLGVPHTEIQIIAHSMESSDKTCCTCLVAVIEYWKDHHTDSPPTWNDLIAAVRKVDETLTLTIRHQLVSDSGQVST